MKVLLVYPSLFPGGNSVAFPMPPLSVLHLAALARAEGHEVELLEPSRFASWLNGPDELQELLSGIDLLAVSSTSLNWFEGRRFIRAARSLRADLPVVAGGVHASRFDGRILDEGDADYVVRGEGERGWAELLARLSRDGSPDLDGVPGLSARDGDGKVTRQPEAELLTPEALGELPLPAYDFVPGDTYNVLPFETSRGCYYSCAFCSIMHQRGWRAPAPERVGERLAQVLDEHGDRFRSPTVCFVDDCFTTRPEHVRGVCEEIRKRGIGHAFMLEARAEDLLQKEVLDALQTIRLAEIQVGIECGYDKGLRKIRKGRLTVEKVHACGEKLAAAGLAGKVMYSFILGLPWEGFDECRRSIETAAELIMRWGGVVNFSWWIPVPSRLWQERAGYGIEVGDELYETPDWPNDVNLFWKTHPRLSPEIVMKLREETNVFRRQGARLYGV